MKFALKIPMLAICLFMGVGLAGCEAGKKISKILADPGIEVGPPKDHPSTVDLTVYARDNANINANGEKSPIDIWFYQLSDNGKFLQSEFYELTAAPEEALNTTFIEVAEMQINPSESKVFSKIELNRKTHYIGIVAGYSDIENANWREVEKVDAIGEGYSVLIMVQKNKIEFNLHR